MTWVPALLVLALAAGAGGSDNSGSGSTATTSAAPTTAGSTAAGGAPTTGGSSATTAAGSGAAVQGVTANSVTIGLIAAKSGPLAEPVKDVFNGFQIWAAETNANGGINGRMIKLKE